MTTPSDPLFSSQWHLAQLGNITRVWDDYTGRGVHVGVYDDGLQFTHPDLNDNYDASRHFRRNGVTYVPTPITLTGADPDAHGTSVAGIIAAEAGNGIGGVGVAYGAALTGVNVLSDSRLESDAMAEAAFRHAAVFDVMSNSWGYDTDFSSDLSLAVTGSTSAGIRAAYHYAVVNGRDGLGTVIVQAAGNEATNAQGSGVNAMREIISVAALTDGAAATDYTNYGSNILIAAGAAEVTTDLTGANGYNTASGTSGNYANDFGGTSAATPVVSGVVALMLDANENLGWRDVQEVLATSARMTGSIVGGDDTNEVQGMVFQSIDRGTGANLSRNGDTWNDGGRAISLDYGFGRADAFAAVRLAEVWTRLHGPAETASNELHRVSQLLASTALHYGSGGGSAVVNLGQTAHLDLDHIAVTFSFRFSNATQDTSGLRIYLADQNGTEFDLMHGGEISYAKLHQGFTWTFGITQAMGLDSAGTWSLHVVDRDGTAPALTSNVIRDVRLDFYGAARDADNIHHITADYLRATNVDDGGLRDRVLQDSNGGTDWLQMATLAANVAVNLTAGQQFRVGGAIWGRIGAGTTLENLVTGDGDDRLTGNGVANILLGMRGNDTLAGGFGADTVEGGRGDDTLAGNRGADLLVGGGGEDRFVFRAGDGHDRVRDFVNDADTLALDSALWGGSALRAGQVVAQFAHVEGGVIEFDFAGGEVLRIGGGISLAALANDIAIV